MAGWTKRTCPRRATARSERRHAGAGRRSAFRSGDRDVGLGRFRCYAPLPRFPPDASPRSSIVAPPSAAPRPRGAGARRGGRGGRRLPLVQPRAALGGGAARLPPAAGHQGHLRRRQGLRRVLPRAAHAGGRRGAPGPRAQRLPRRRGRRLLPARGARLPRHGARRHQGAAPRRPPDRRLHHHPAGLPEPPAVPGAEAEPEDPRVDPHPAHGAGAHQGPDPQPLPEPDLLRAQPLRRRGGGALLLRQARLGAEPWRRRRCSPAWCSSPSASTRSPA